MANKVLSVSSSLRTGDYKTGRTMFFTQSKLFEAQMTEIFDEVWPTVTALKMLRWQVKGYYEEYCVQDNSRLSAKFVEPEDVTNRPNLYRTCIDETWEDTEFKIAKNLLTNIFACYEGWCENILVTLNYTDFRNGAKQLQFPSTTATGYNILLSRISVGGNPDLISAFYDEYKTKSRHYRIDLIDNWFLFYRYFKECRNAIIHNGGQTTQRVIDAYSNIQHFTEADLDVKEVPQVFPPVLNEPIKLSLRGVVGFSQLTIKIVSTLDVELIKAKNADEYFVKRVSEAVKLRKTVSSEIDRRNYQIKSFAYKGSFNTPSDIEALYRILRSHNVIN